MESKITRKQKTHRRMTTYDSYHKKSEDYVLSNEFHEAKKFFHNEVKKTKEDAKVISSIFLSKHLLYLSEYSEAIKILSDLEQLIKESKLQKNLFLEGNVNLFLGLAKEKNGEYDEGIEYMIKARKCFAGNSSQKQLLADSFVGLSKLYSQTGNYELSESYAYLAITLYNEIKSPNYKLAQAYNQLGMVYWLNHHLKQDDFFFKEAVKYLLDSPIGGDHIFLAEYYKNFGLYYWREGRNSKKEKPDQSPDQSYTDGINYLNKSLEILERCFKDKAHSDIAMIFHKLGLLHGGKEEFGVAEKFHNTAHKMYVKIFGSHHSDIGRNHNDLGRLKFNNGKFEDALKQFQLGMIAVVSEFKDKDWKSNPFIDLDKIDSYLPLIQSLERKSNTLIAQYEEEEKEEILNAAKYCLNQGYDLLSKISEKTMNHLGSLNFKYNSIGITENFLYVVSKLNESKKKDHVYKMKLIAEAFNVTEFTKKVSFLNKERSNEFKESSDNNYGESTINGKYISDLQSYRNSFSKREMPEYKSVFLTEIDATEKDFLKLKNHKNLREKVTTLEETQDAIDDKKGAILSYFIGFKYSFVFIIAKEYCKLVRISNKSTIESFKSKINNFKNILDNECKDLFGKEERFMHLSLETYQQLFGAFGNDDYLKNIDRIYIIADKLVQGVPFGALVSKRCETANYSYGDLDYLLERFSFSYHYSVTSLVKYYREQTVKNNSIPIDHSFKFIGFAPTLKTEEGGRMKNIDEVKNILGLFEKEKYKRKSIMGYTGEEATLDNYIKNAGDGGIIHIASHMRMKESSTDSGIIFYCPKEEKLPLNFHEILKYKVNAGLVVLACCKTGAPIVSYDEVTTLERAFLEAGARNVIYTLFEVPDTACYDFMQDLYKHILNEETYARALHKSKKAAIRRNPNPISWAGFVIAGDHLLRFKDLYS